MISSSRLQAPIKAGGDFFENEIFIKFYILLAIIVPIFKEISRILFELLTTKLFSLYKFHRVYCKILGRHRQSFIKIKAQMFSNFKWNKETSEVGVKRD